MHTDSTVPSQQHIADLLGVSLQEDDLDLCAIDCAWFLIDAGYDLEFEIDLIKRAITAPPEIRHQNFVAAALYAARCIQRTIHDLRKADSARS